MSRPGISYQEVANTAIQIQGQNENPTVDRVRALLGTGSKSTIARYLKEWKSNSGHIASSHGVPQELISIVKGLWDRLNSEAEHKITLSQQETSQIIDEAHKSLALEQKRNIDLQTQLRQLEDQLHQEKNLSTNIHHLLEEEKRCNSKLAERNDRLIQQLDDQKNETTRLHNLLSHVQNNLEHYQSSVQKLREEQILAMEKQKSSYEHEASLHKKELSELTTNHNQQKNECNQLRLELKILKDQLDVTLSEQKQYYQQLQEKIITEITLKNTCNQIQKSCVDYENKLAQQTKINFELEKQQAIIFNQVENLKKSVQDAQDTIRILRDEKLYLAQEKALLEGQLKQLQMSL